MKEQVIKNQLKITAKQIFLLFITWIFISIVIIFSDLSPIVKTPIILFKIILIGLLILINLKVKLDYKYEYLLYSVGLGFSFFMLGGLGINWLFPIFGVFQPLSKVSLLFFFNTVIFLLAFRAYLINKEYLFLYKINQFNRKDALFGIIPLVFVILSIVGSSLLNSFGIGGVTIFMLFCIALYFVIIMTHKESFQDWVYLSGLYFIGLSLLLMYSLRSSHIIGWDINEEYQVFQMTLKNLLWKMSYYPNLDYNSCISITILPTIMKVLTGVSPEYVFKFIFQVFFAITPLSVYVIAKRYLNSKLSFLASFLFISQTWFFEQMPALIRQEIAFIFYILIVLILFDKKLSKWIRYLLFYIFFASLVISHYSTSYIFIALLFGTITLSYLGKLFFKSLRDNVVFIKPAMLIIPFLFLIVWQVPITHTGQAFSKFFTNNKDTDEVLENLPSVLDDNNVEMVKTNNLNSGEINTELNKNLPTLNSFSFDLIGIISKVLFIENNTNLNEDIFLAQEKAVLKYGSQAGYDTYTGAEILNFVPQTVDSRVYNDKSLPDFFSIVLNLISRLSKLLLANIFVSFGVAIMFFSFYTKKTKEEYEFVIFNTIALSFIILIIFIPYIQVHYNFTRLFLQMFLTLSVFSVIGGMTFIKIFSRNQTLVITALTTIMFLSLSGAIGHFISGEKRITLNSIPSIHDIYYIYDAEIAGAKWLSNNRSMSLPVQSDVVANLRLQSFGNMNVDNTRIFPATLLRNSYVYLIDKNINEEHAFYQFLNNTLVYKYPIDFINEQKNLIYSNSSSRIYK